jgi:hypothetical protein
VIHLVNHEDGFRRYVARHIAKQKSLKRKIRYLEWAIVLSRTGAIIFAGKVLMEIYKAYHGVSCVDGP